MAALQAYDWPGNVRELQNVIERAMILSEGPVLSVEEALGPTALERDAGDRRRAGDSLEEIERAHIVEVLERCRWTIEGRGQAAARLGLNEHAAGPDAEAQNQATGTVGGPAPSAKARISRPTDVP
jgi:formate hydrogenlyase transcriptional activator